MSTARLGNLILALSTGSALDVELLLKRDPALANQEHPSGTTPLYFAVRHQRPRIVQHLIDLGADVNPPLAGRESLLEMADALPSQEVFDILNRSGAKRKPTRVRKRESRPVYPTVWHLEPSDMPLCEAASNSRFASEARKLGHRRLRQLLTACCEEREETLALRLINILPTVDYCTEDEGSPLLGAASSGCLTIVQSLLAAGSKREVIGAFDFAVTRGHVDVAAELLALVRTKKNYWARESPHMALQAASKGYTVMAELLLPFASPKSAAIAKRRIAAWRNEYEDLAPECFDWASE